MMKSLRFLLAIALVLCLSTGTQGFMPTRKKSTDRHTAFSDSNNDEEVHATTQTQYLPAASPTAAFSVPPTAIVAAFQEYEFEEEEAEVPYEVALISCIVSLAIGFGTGYLV